MERLYNGIVKENPTFVLMLGMCPTLAVSTAAVNGLGMGFSTLAVLVLSNLIISLLRRVIPDEVRLPSYIVIVASLVTVTELLIKAYLPAIYSALGLYIPLIVVNCIILGRAEAYANKAKPLPAVFDGVGMGLGFTIALTALGMIRELLGAGTLFGLRVLPESVEPVGIFIKAPGAFLVLGFMIAVLNYFNVKNRSSQMVEGCDGCCAACAKGPGHAASCAGPQNAGASGEEAVK